jgi:hypothetical protein
MRHYASSLTDADPPIRARLRLMVSFAMSEDIHISFLNGFVSARHAIDLMRWDRRPCTRPSLLAALMHGRRRLTEPRYDFLENAVLSKLLQIAVGHQPIGIPITAADSLL